MRTICCLIILALHLMAARSSHGYVDSAKTLGGLCYAAQTINVVRVKKVGRAQRIIIYETIATLKGDEPSTVMRHHFPVEGQPGSRLIMDWAEPGKIAVCFTHGKVVETFIGNVWYECANTQDDWWTLTRECPEMSLAYSGPVGNLRDRVKEIVQGKETVITAVRHRGEGPALYDSVAFKSLLQGSHFPVWRLRASLKMPSCYITLTEPQSPWVVGLGAGGAEGVEQHIRALGKSDPEERREAADELALRGADALPALSALRMLLNDDDLFVRAHASAALLRTGIDTQAGCETLAALAKDPATSVRWEAISLLGGNREVANVLPLLINSLQDSDDRVRRAAARSLGQLGPAASPAATSLAALVGDPSVSPEAFQSLGDLGKTAKAAVPELLKTLERSSPEIRRGCALALTRIDPANAAPAAEVFLEILKSHDERDRWDAVAYFAHLGPAAAGVVPALGRLMQGTDPGVRASAARVLANLGPLAKPAMPALLEVLKHPDVVARRHALNVLTNMPKEAKPAVPILLKTLQDAALQSKNAEYVKAVANALRMIDPKIAAEAGIK